MTHLKIAKIFDSISSAASDEDEEQTGPGSTSRSTRHLCDSLAQCQDYLSSIPTDTVICLLKVLDGHVRRGSHVELPRNEEVRHRSNILVTFVRTFQVCHGSPLRRSQIEHAFDFPVNKHDGNCKSDAEHDCPCFRDTCRNLPDARLADVQRI